MVKSNPIKLETILFLIVGINLKTNFRDVIDEDAEQVEQVSLIFLFNQTACAGLCQRGFE